MNMRKFGVPSLAAMMFALTLGASAGTGSAWAEPAGPSGAAPALEATSSMSVPTASDLPAELFGPFNKLSEADRKKILDDPLFFDELDAVDPKQRVAFFKAWVDGLRDNFCREYLSQVAARAFSREGLTKLDLPTALKGCPVGVSLDDTLKYVNGKLKAAFDDPYTVILSEPEGKVFKEMVTGKQTLLGIGLQFSVYAEPRAAADEHPGDKSVDAKPGAIGSSDNEDHFVYKFKGLVYHVISGSPAEEVGLKDGDRVVAVDGEAVIGKELNYVLGEKIRGPLGTSVKLTVERDGARFDIEVPRRAMDHKDAVWMRKIQGTEAYYSIVIDEWREDVAGEVLVLLQKAKKLGARGVVIDVRHNGGGLWNEAIMTASMFVKNGVLVTTENRLPSVGAALYSSVKWERRDGALYRIATNTATGEIKEDRLKVGISRVDAAGKELPFEEADVPFVDDLPPVVVLGDGRSGSASEVFIGALMKNHREHVHNHPHDAGHEAGHDAAVQGAQPADNSARGIKPVEASPVVEATQPQDDVAAAPFVGSPTFGKGIAQSNTDGPFRTRISITTGRYFLNDGTWPGDAHKEKHPLQPNLLVIQPVGVMPYTVDDLQLNAAVRALDEIDAGSPLH